MNKECSEICAPSCGFELHKLYADTIDHIEFKGGMKYGNQLKIFFTSGKVLCVDAELSASKYAIRPQINYSIGAWGCIDNLKVSTQKS